jgi:hypothetical protein
MIESFKYGTPLEVLSEFASLDGLGALYDLADDGRTWSAEAPGSFRFPNGADSPEWVAIGRCVIYVQGSGQLTADKFGPISALSNGIDLRVVRSNGQLYSLTDPFPITANSTLKEHCYDVSRHDYGSGDNAIAAQWDFWRSGAPVYLAPGDYIEALVRDDLSDLSRCTFKFDGVKLKGETHFS